MYPATMPTTYALECQGGPADGLTVALGVGVRRFAYRDQGGTWHRYEARPDDDGVALAYRGPMLPEPPEPLRAPDPAPEVE